MKSDAFRENFNLVWGSSGDIKTIVEANPDHFTFPPKHISFIQHFTNDILSTISAIQTKFLAQRKQIKSEIERVTRLMEKEKEEYSACCGESGISIHESNVHSEKTI